MTFLESDQSRALDYTCSQRTEMSEKEKIFVGAASLLLLFSLGLRVIYLSHIPGLSGDEALIGNMIYDLLAGREVSWDVPTGKKMSPLFVAMGMPFFMALPPTILTLRLPALFWGLAMVVLTWFCLRRVMSRRGAMAVTVLVACAPIHLVYSRLYIEQGLMGLTAVWALTSALRGEKFSLLLAYTTGLLIHPVNIFLTPLLLAAFGHHVWFDPKLNHKQKQVWLKAGVAFCIAGIVSIFLYVPDRFNLLVIAHHLTHPGVFLMFVYYFCAVLSGVTVVQDFAGPLSPPWAFVANLLMAFAFLGALGIGLTRLAKRKDTRAMAVVIGWILSIIAFYLVGGLLGVHPGTQRYALFIVIPTLYCLYLLWGAFVGKEREQHLVVGAFFVSALFLLLFASGFINKFVETGGRSHLLYQTAAIDPKRQAFDLISQRQEGRPTLVVAEDFWIYQPMRYFAQKSPSFEVAQVGKQIVNAEQIKKILSRGGYFVFWTSHQVEKGLVTGLDPSRYSIETILGGAGQPLISILQLR